MLCSFTSVHAGCGSSVGKVTSREVTGSNPSGAALKLGQVVYPTLPVSFG